MMQKVRHIAAKFTGFLVLLSLLTLFSIAFPGNTVKAASRASTITTACTGYYIYEQSDVVTNNQEYSLYIDVYNDHCGDFYVEATGFVPQGNAGGGTICLTFSNSQSCTAAGPGALHGSYYVAYSHYTHLADGDPVAEFTNIPGGNLHVDDSYFCISSC